MIVDVSRLKARYPGTLDEAEVSRAEVLLQDAVAVIAAEFHRRGMNLDQHLTTFPWLESVVERVACEMVQSVLLMGTAAGKRSYSVTVGDTTEATTWQDSHGSPWGLLRLLPEHLEMLGLAPRNTPRGSFPCKGSWPESPRHFRSGGGCCV